MQQGMLVENTLAGLPWANVEQVVVEGPLPQFAADALRSAWTTLALRHDALRMVLRSDDTGRLVQAVLTAADVVIERHDFSAIPAADQAAAVDAFLAKDRITGVDPAERPGWRISLLDLSATRAVMVWTIHHALIDGTSMAIVLEELADLLAGSPLGPAPLLGFAAFSARLQAQDKTAAQGFFAQMFADGHGAVPLVPGHSAPPGRMALCSSQLTAEETAALRRKVAALGTTALNAVQLVWALVLARWTGQAEACFGLVESGRTLMPGIDCTVGCLIATLPFRVRLEGKDTLSTVLPRLREATLCLRAHSHVSLTEIRRWAKLPGQAVLFDTIVMYTRATLESRMRRVGQDWQVRLREEGTAAVTLAVADDPELQIILEHDPTCVSAAMAKALTAQVTRLLSALAHADATTQLGDLPMLSPDEIAELVALGQPDAPLPDALPCIATRFEAVAAATPHAVAIVDGATGLSMTYAALDRAANALAFRLQAAGVQPGEIVALHLPRGPEHVTALLAVLKLGAAFLPLDLDLPCEWRADLARRAGISAVIAAQLQMNVADFGTHTLLVPDIFDGRDQPPARPQPDAQRLAYVLYTSGSTGAPKAVRGLCGALSAHASAAIMAFGLTPDDKVLHFACLGFDVALEEIVPTLLTGATVVIRDEAASGSVRSFLELLTRHRVTVANLPASFWHVLVDEMAEAGLLPPPSLRLLIAGSERVQPRALQRWRKIAPQVAWMNGYGPTETTITATLFALPPDASLPAPDEDVPIGRPMAHARVALRAFDGSLTPKGGRGMLWIAGPAVTGGYLGDDARSQISFQPDPASPDQMRYSTGDQARWRQDGQLAFLGRQDRQVKLRGHRIDLYQLEQQIARLHGVRSVHLALRSEPTVRLLAWVVLQPGATLAGVATAAAQSLPHVMLPQWIVIDSLPIGANGKVDSRNLPLPQPDPDTAQDDTPKDPLARAIAACMAEVLDRPSVPAEASFSDLGGDSLLALRLVSLIEKRTGHALQTANLHHHGSAAALARMLQSGATKPRYTIPIQPQGSKPPFFAIHVLGRNEDLFRPLAAALGPDQPMFGLSVGIPRNLDDINVERTARIYFDEIQTYFPTGPVGLGAVSMAAYFAYELAQLLHAAGREVRVLAVLDAMGPDGRPALTGAAKLRAHLQQVRQHGLWHFARVVKNRLDRARERREALRSAPDQVNAHNLIAANVCAVEFYQPKPYEGPLTVFRADHSFWDSPEALATGLGWVSVAKGGLTMHDLPGTHLSILHPGNVEVLAAHIRRLMAAEDDKSRP